MLIFIKYCCGCFRYEKLDEEDCQQVQLLVFCTHKQVAHAAGQFLYKRIKDAADEVISSRSKKGTGLKAKCAIRLAGLTDLSTDFNNNSN